MYPRNAASPEPVAIGAVVQISDGAVQTSGVTVRIKPIGVSEGDGGGTTAYSTDGIVLYTPTQAETNYTSFILIAKKTGCIPVSVTVITTASATPGYAGLDWGVMANKTTTNNLSGTTIKTATDVETDTADIQSRLPAALTGDGNLKVDVLAVSGDATAADTLELFAEALDQTTGQIDSGSFAAGAIDAAAIANGAIDAATFAADVDAEILSYIVDDATRIDASALNTASGTTIPAIVADTNELQTDWVNGGRLDLIVDAILDDTDLIDDGTSGLAKIATDVAAILVDTGTTLQGELDGIQADTEDIQSRLPAALVNSRMDCTIDGTGMESGAVAAVVAGVGLTLASGTIGDTGNSTTALHLTGLTYGDDELNDYLIVIRDVSESEYHARWISDWTATGDLATVATLPFTPQNSTDTYTVLAVRQDVTGGSGPSAADIADAVLDEALSGHTNAGSLGKAIADIEVDTSTTLQGELDGIQADTEDIQSRLPAALTADGNIKADTLRVGGTLQTAGDLAALIATATGYIDTEISTILTRLGTPSDLGSGASVAANLVDIESQTDDIGAAGAGLTALATAAELAKVPKSDSNVTWNATALASIQTEAEDALIAHNLDHLVKIAVDTNFATTVHLDSVIGQLADNGTTATFDRTTDSLEAVRDRGDAAWITATGFSTHTAADVWSSGTRTLTAIDEDSTTLDLDATIRAAVGMASANLDTQLADLPTVAEFEARTIAAATYATAANLATVAGYLDTEIAAILEDTGTTIPAQISALNNLSAAQVNAEVDTALADIHLDHLLATDYDPANKPGTATALLNELVESDAGVSRFTTNALEQSPTGSGGFTSDDRTTLEAIPTFNEIWTTALTEAYASDGAAFTPAQGLFMIWSALTEFSVSGTTITCKKLDGTTTSFTFAMDSSSAPTSRTRSS